MSIWDALSTDSLSDRSDVLHNIDDIWGSAALTVHDWKVLKGTNYKGDWDKWYGPAGNRSESSYDIKAVLNSAAGIALNDINDLPSIEKIKKLRHLTNVDCTVIPFNITRIKPCQPLREPCLFKISEDPCEKYNLADK